MAQFAKGVDPDEVAHNEPPHLDLHCLPSLNSQCHIALTVFEKLQTKLCRLLFW